MQKFQLELLFHLIGIGSASGIIYKDNSIFLISDNSANLFEYHTETKSLEKTMLFENETSENIPKALKPDFEAIANFGDDYYIFGSGSTENRNKMVRYNSKTKALKTIDLTNLYLLMQSFGEIPPQDFNIEGVVFTGETWYFFQRGNGAKGKNGIFTVQGKNLENDFTILFNKYKLPKIKGVQSSFTDAVLVGKQLYFLAAAENSISTYDDGEVLGSLVGSINIQTMKLESTQKISDSHKFEGITLYKNEESQIEFLLCEDNDTEHLESDVFKLTLKK
jgi:hypothetical protein